MKMSLASRRPDPNPIVFLLLLLFGMLASGCTLARSLPSSLPFFGPTLTPTASPTPTSTPTPVPTPTPPPTPTPVPAVRIEAGDHALFIGDWDQALSEYQAAYSGANDPDLQSAALLGLARTKLQTGDTAGAVKALEQLIQNYPNSPHLPEAFFALGQADTDLERYSRAAEAYLNYLTRRSGLVDGYVLELRGDALRAAGDFGGAINDYKAALQTQGFFNSFQIEIKIADAHATAGDYETSLALFSDLYNRADDDYTKAQMDLRMGQVYTALGRIADAQRVFLDAVTNFPKSYDSYQALLALVEAGVPVDELNRGIVDYFAGQYGVAAAALDRYLKAAPVDPATAHYYDGLAQRQLGNYQAAIQHWDAVIQGSADHRFWDDAWEEKAYTQWAYLENYSQATQTLLDFVAAAPAHPRAGEFLFDAAQVAERDGKLSQAAELWQRVASLYPGYEKASRALFLAGISHYRMKDYSGALQVFQAYLSQATSVNDRAAGYLWQAKSHREMGDPEAAKTALEQAASADPTGYYSERARDLLRGRPPFDPPQVFDLIRDVAGERAQAEAWMRTSFGLSPDIDLSSPGALQSDPRFLRGTELWKLGLYDDARAEFEDLRKSVETDPANTFRLANYLVNIGMYRSAILAARQVLSLAGMNDAATMSAPDYFNYIRFGPYFGDLILPQAQADGFHPLFLFSVVRQESAFEGFVRSSAGARGLMQIVPATGEEIADSIGWPPAYQSSDLYRPQVSLRLGASYLAKWRDHFQGNLYAALAAYNGGPGNASAWLELAGDDPDLFLEIIRFDETRNYIRGIYEIFSIYRRLYDRSP